MRIRSYTATLSDGSKATNVVLDCDGRQIEFHAVTKRDANALITKLYEAILVHTVDSVTVPA